MLQKAFTLIELLIVVAIIAILAAIAVPNFLEAQTRSKVSRSRSDMRTIATALESYAVDNTVYPLVNQIQGYALPWSNTSATSKNGGLTTPIAYISGVLYDPFGGKDMADDAYNNPSAGWGSTKEYWYWTEAYVDTPHGSWGGPGNWNASVGKDGQCKWCLMSRGPDMVWAHISNPVSGYQEVNIPRRWAYDATNGTVSWGNIVRVGP